MLGRARCKTVRVRPSRFFGQGAGLELGRLQTWENEMRRDGNYLCLLRSQTLKESPMCAHSKSGEVRGHPAGRLPGREGSEGSERQGGAGEGARR